MLFPHPVHRVHCPLSCHLFMFAWSLGSLSSCSFSSCSAGEVSERCLLADEILPIWVGVQEPMTSCWHGGLFCAWVFIYDSYVGVAVGVLVEERFVHRIRFEGGSISTLEANSQGISAPNWWDTKLHMDPIQEPHDSMMEGLSSGFRVLFVWSHMIMLHKLHYMIVTMHYIYVVF